MKHYSIAAAYGVLGLILGASSANAQTKFPYGVPDSPDFNQQSAGAGNPSDQGLTEEELELQTSQQFDSLSIQANTPSDVPLTELYLSFSIGGSAAEYDGFDFATEEPAGNLVNPALEYSYWIVGLDASLDASYRFNERWGISLGVDYSDLAGDYRQTNTDFDNGFGVTGVGERPGVFIGSPTQLEEFEVETDWSRVVGSAQVNLSLGQAEREFAGFNSIYEFTGFGGVRAGQVEQRELAMGYFQTPAFGRDSAWMARYDTEIDADVYGFYLGAAMVKSTPFQETFSLITGASAYIGYDKYDLSINDSVRASGLGGALAYDSANSFSYDEGLVTGGAGLQVGLSSGRVDWTLNAGVNWNDIPQIDYKRGDSDAAGNPLTPDVSLETNTSYSLGTSFSVRF